MTPRVTLTTMLIGAVLIAAPAWIEDDTRLIWNASASVPIGLYRIEPAGHIDVADLVVVMPPDDLADYLAGRGYLSHGVPLIKRVLALPGATVCRNGMMVTVDDHACGEALERDSLGRDLPVWEGCHVIADGELFMMNWDAADSFDGRYFGPILVSTVIGRAIPIWTLSDTDTAANEFHEPVSDEP